MFSVLAKPVEPSSFESLAVSNRITLEPLTIDHLRMWKTPFDNCTQDSLQSHMFGE